MNTIDLDVEGMSCGACVKHVTQVLQSLPGVDGVAVDLQTGRARINGALAQGGEALVSALADAGYPARPATAVTPIVQSAGSDCQSGKTGGCTCG